MFHHDYIPRPIQQIYTHAIRYVKGKKRGGKKEDERVPPKMTSSFLENIFRRTSRVPREDKVVESTFYKSTGDPPFLLPYRELCIRRAPGRQPEREAFREARFHIISQSPRLASVLLESRAFNVHRISKGVAPENRSIRIREESLPSAGLVDLEYS